MQCNADKKAIIITVLTHLPFKMSRNYTRLASPRIHYLPVHDDISYIVNKEVLTQWYVSVQSSGINLTADSWRNKHVRYEYLLATCVVLDIIINNATAVCDIS